MIARGKTRQILIKVGEIQDRVGMARGLHYDDRSQDAFEKAQDLLKEAFDLCIEITGEYDQITTLRVRRRKGA